MRRYAVAAAALFAALAQAHLHAQSFVNWENPHVHPIDLTPDGATLLAVNTPDNRLELFAVTANGLTWSGSVQVGLDPVSVRARSATEAWVVNHISDSISIVDLTTRRVTMTIDTNDEPADVVFAGAPQRAFVTCSQMNQVQVFSTSNPSAPPSVVAIGGEDPRALAVSPDGTKVYVAVFESGNGTTILGGGSTMTNGSPPNVVSHPSGPYGGQNPPPNFGNQFKPPVKVGLPTPPKVGLIVRKNTSGQWMDDNAHNWTAFVSGASAALSGRPVNWDLPDRDLFVVDANTLAVSSVSRLMNLCMAIAVHPTSGDVTIVGTDATNEVRFEPNVNGTFVRVKSARVSSNTLAVQQNVDLNPHLTYTVANAPQSERDKSIGDPRGVAWHPSGTRGFVTGMGSNNVVRIDATGARVAGVAPIEVGEGPTGLVHHPTLERLYVLNKFAGSVSVIDSVAETVLAEVKFFDPSPSAIKSGRKFLYGTHETSGLGQASCASCHIDARIDRLAWDLGDPQGSMKALTGQNLGANVPGINTGFQPWHPMKGPMTTQTLQDIIGKEPLHWRGDRAGIEEFNPAFVGLLGDDTQLSTPEMQAFENFLATISFPPNPYRNVDNTMPSSVATGMVSPGRFSPKGTPLPPGNPNNGVIAYRPPNLLDAGTIACSSCHNLPTGMGTDTTFSLATLTFNPIAAGPKGERHHMLVSQDGSTNVTIKVPQLRNLYDKVGFDTAFTSNLSGFGFLHDGSVDTLATFIAEPVFNPTSDQQLADLVALMLCFAGGDLPYGGQLLEPPATASKDTHAGVGTQTTVVNGASPATGQFALIDQMIALANTNDVDVVVKGNQGGLARGFVYVGANSLQSDRLAETTTVAALKLAASAGSELTWTLVPEGSGTRIGVDRDLDGFFDRDELDAGSDPADPLSIPGCGTMGTYGLGCAGSGNVAPRLQLAGCAKSGGNVTITIDKALGGSFAFVFFGLGEAAIPMGYDCTLNVAPLLAPVLGPLPLSGSGAGNGTISLPGTLPLGLPQVTITMQAFVSDAGGAGGFANSNGAKLGVQ
jgi:YVTN family beta-propeller protein